MEGSFYIDGEEIPSIVEKPVKTLTGVQFHGVDRLQCLENSIPLIRRSCLVN